MFAGLFVLVLACSSGEPTPTTEPSTTPPEPTPTAPLPSPEPAVSGGDGVVTPEPVPGAEVAPPEPAPAPEGSPPASTASSTAGAVAPVPAPAASAPVPAVSGGTTEASSSPAGTGASEGAASGGEPPPALVSAQTYAVGPSSGSQLYVQVFKDPDTAGAGLSHDHVVVARGWTGTVRWHPTDASQCLIDITLPVAKLEADAPAMRSAVGYDVELTDSQRETVKKNLLAESQLDGAGHPNITYRSRSCSGTTGAVTVVGDLTIRGQTRSVTSSMQVSLEGGFSASGSFKAKHSDFGFQPYTAMMGALKNLDQMKFTVRLKG